MSAAAPRPRTGWTLAIVSIALFMSTLDNLVVGVALPSIRADFGSTLESLQWTVNAYTIAYAVLLLTGCNTVHGIGKDIEKGGEAIQKVAK